VDNSHLGESLDDRLVGSPCFGSTRSPSSKLTRPLVPEVRFTSPPTGSTPGRARFLRPSGPDRVRSPDGLTWTPIYEQIARNKRRAAVCVVLFFVVWVGIGALLGFLWAELSRPSSGPARAWRGHNGGDRAGSGPGPSRDRLLGHLG
jgi:hypothetical protein